MFESARKFARVFAADSRGATAIEYGLITAIIGIGIILSANAISTALDVTFTNVSNGFAAALG